MWINWPNKSDFLFTKQKSMKTISDWEKLTQLALNKKYLELEEKDKEIQKLQRELYVLQMQIDEYKETISQLCVQMNRLFLKQKQNAD